MSEERSLVFPARNPFPPRGTTSMEERVLDSALSTWELDAPTAELPAVELLWSIAQRYMSGFATGLRGQGQVAFLHGDHGTGKTHAVRHMLSRLSARPRSPGPAPYRLYVKAQDDDFLSCYRRLMSQIDPPVLRDLSLRFLGAIAGVEAGRAYGAETEASATEALREEPDHLYAMIRDMMVEPGAVLQSQARELSEITGDQEDFQRALTSLLDPLLEAAAYDWLVGREIDPVDASRLGVSGSITDHELCRYGIQLMVAMCSRSGRPVVVVIDQCERLMLGEVEETGRRNEGLLHSLAERVPQENGMLVLIGNEQAWDRMRRDLKQRFGHNVVASSAMNLDQAVRLLQVYLREVSGAEDEIRPFRLSGVRALLAQSEGNARRLLQLAWLAYERAAPDRAPITRAMVERALDGEQPSSRAAPPGPTTLGEVVARLEESERLTVVELGGEGLIAFDLHRDAAGTPHGRSRPMMPWPGPPDGRADHRAAAREHLPEDARAAVLRAAGVPVTADVVLVCTSPESPQASQAMDWLSAAHPEAACFTEPGADVVELLRRTIAADPLRLPYELVALRADPDSGRLLLDTLPLFPAGARGGESAEVTVHCPPADERGTAFAIVAWRGDAPTLVSVHSATLVPGRRTFTAELLRPGRVRFAGLRGLGGPVKEDRGWEELVAAVPDKLDGSWESVHVICAVEISGPLGTVRERLLRVRQVITVAAEALLGMLEVSLVVYGEHSYDRDAADQPVVVAAWRTTLEEALRALGDLRLERRPGGYPYAAQVEDMLDTVVSRLSLDAEGRSVLLTVGDRPPHPPRVHRSEILPCPRRYDWEALLSRLDPHPGIALAAICDRPPDQADAVWTRLNGGRPAASLDTVDVRRLVADVGLPLSSARRIPFPMIDGVPPSHPPTLSEASRVT
ncbi:hypothetical protein [Sphaerisporangium dianthi]|uniref:AAA+ ATPase domain-containing protein n=1 Tax=Sphaerisporangium dianthi TaxID=1436120 RepID=A0ABV9CCD8_9ACTN